MNARQTLECSEERVAETFEQPSTSQVVSQRFQPHFMLVPSLACPAECSYCFGPHRGPIMSAETMDAALNFMTRVVGETGQRKIKVTFHGGEPLLAGHAIWRQALEGLAARFGPKHCDLAIQSNLWQLGDEFCRLFRQHRVDVGTSLDGPEEITDAQRGRGYFARTMQAVRRAQSQGIKVGCIATFTPASLPRWREVFDFFLNERLGFSIHAAVPPLPNGRSSRGDEVPFLTPTQYAALLRQMLDHYIEHRRELAVSSLDQMCQGFGCGEGKVCTFRDCLGMFLAIDPNGGIYPCQRFCGQPQHRLGALQDQPTLAELFSSPIALRMAARQKEIRLACRGCAHLEYCHGGCPYNAWAGGSDGGIRDPYCGAYREVFDYLQRRMAEELAAEANLNAIAGRPWDGCGNPLLRKGPLIDLVREGPHPSHTARTAKRIVAAVELAKGPDIPTVGTRLVQMGLCHTQQSAEASLHHLWQQLHPEKVRLNNLYLHVTFDCQLRCTHCYACAGSSPSPVGRERAGVRANGAAEMPIRALEKLLHEAKECGFRQVIITGGEPLIHSQRDAMLDMLAKARTWTAPMNLVLRTNFALSLDEEDLRRVAAAFDQVVASVDGSQQTHDARRGPGTYAGTVHNLEAYAALCGNSIAPLRLRGEISPIQGSRLEPSDPPSGRARSPLRAETRRAADCPPYEEVRAEAFRNRLPSAELSIACVMRAADIQGEAGDAVRQLAQRLGIRRTRFRPLLPLGRAADWTEPPQSEALGAHTDPLGLIENRFQPVASCGLGQNLYVEPSGESFPCYAYHQAHSLFGNVLIYGLSSVLKSERFRDLAKHTVDTNPQCRACDLRYLCGGACRAWGGGACQHNLDAPPPECDGLRTRAAELLAAATDYLDHQPSLRRGNPPCSHH
jgi:uncharacterized protein